VSNLTTSNSAATPLPPTAVTGRVINAVTGLPVPRALVHLNNRSILTDHEGKFDFEQVTETNGGLFVTKPGFAMTNDPGATIIQTFQMSQLTAPVEVKLYPEGVLTGTLTAPDGEPLGQVNVEARRSVFDESGHHWTGAGTGRTDSHGEFRIPVPAGDYRLESHYVPRSAGAAEAVLPVSVPTPGAADGPQAIHIRNGEEQHFDLHPAVRHTYPVAISIDNGQDRGFPVITARASDGSIFNVSAMPNRGQDGPGHASLSLPTGSYLLTARIQNQDGLQTAEARVTVTGSESDAGPVALRFLATPSIPVDLAVDSSATSDNTSGSASSAASITAPTPLQFGLTLQRLDPTSADEATSISLSSQRAGVVAFNAPPGTYRLLARVQNRWYIRSASFGATDLLREPITVAAGTSSAPIRLVVTNQTGGLQATVKLAGQPATGWVYLLRTTPSAALLTTLHSNSTTGAISSPYLPPGTYQAIAFERHPSIDFTNPAVLARFSTYIQSVTITAGSTSSLNLNAVPQSETEAKP